MTDKTDYRKMATTDWGLGWREEAMLSILFSLDDRLEQLVEMAKPKTFVMGTTSPNLAPFEERDLTPYIKMVDKAAAEVALQAKEVEFEEERKEYEERIDSLGLRLTQAAFQRDGYDQDRQAERQRADRAEGLLLEIVEDMAAQADRCERTGLDDCEHVITTLRRILKSHTVRAES